MNAYRIDTVAALRAAHLWAGWGDDVTSVRVRTDADAARLQLDGRAAWVGRSLALAAGELWAASRLVAGVVDQAESADHGLDAAAFSDILLTQTGLLVSVHGACPAPPGVSSIRGDRGGTYDVELRSPYDIAAPDPVALGRRLVMRALADTASLAQVHPDEFEVVSLSDHRYLVVLPGVTDLSRPDLGYSELHRSVRDLDREAYSSLPSARIEDNGYARMVSEALGLMGVAAGSELVLVGHSFGADTALDLAADPSFNGSGRYRVTHVVAAGYDSGPQLAHVPDSTRVLVLQNRDDAVVIAEQIARAHVVEAVEAHVELVASAARLDPGAVGAAAVSAAWHDAGVVSAGVMHLVDHVPDLLGASAAIASGDLHEAIDHAHAVVTADPGTRVRSGSQVSVVFDGGASGGGHRQQHYLDHLAASEDPAVVAFLASLGAAMAGTATGTGTAVAIDVSVPEHDRRDPRVPGSAPAPTPTTEKS